MNIYQVKFDAKKENIQNSFTIVVDAHCAYEGDAIEEAKNHIKRHYEGILSLELKSVCFLETVENRSKKINQFNRD
jgi:hypothetical protein